MVARKEWKFSRKKYNTQEENILTVDIKPGWKAGTKITFPGEGDVLQNRSPQDVIFIIQERQHDDLREKVII